MTEHQFSIFADYFQFFIVDEASNDDLSEDQLDGKDCYRIEIWPAPPATLRVRKQHATPGDTSVQAPT